MPAEDGVDVPSLADVVVAACAEAFRGDGETFASGIGTIQMLAARLARATFEPELLISDGEALFVANDLAIGGEAAGRASDRQGAARRWGPGAQPPQQHGGMDKVVEGYIPFRRVFETLWAGRRHVMMSASQIDRFGNTNISAIGDWARPKAQLLGVRGAPGNTICHETSFFMPDHSRRVFVDAVDVVSGLGYERAAVVAEHTQVWHRIPRVVTNLAVLDFETADHTMRLVSTHPGVTVEEVLEATGFELLTEGAIETPLPSAEALAVLSRLDPGRLRDREVPSR